MPPAEAAVHIWWAVLHTPDPALAALLSGPERDRLSGIRQPPDRDRFVLACAITRLVLADRLGLTPAEVPLVRRCPTCQGPHGKVTVADPRAPQLSITHGGGLVGVAFCPEAAVGLDVEPRSRKLRVDLLTDRSLAPAEAAGLAGLAAADRPAAFLRLWTRKEAVAKCDGLGLRRPLRDLDVSEPHRMPELHLADLDPDSGHLGALAVRTPAGVSVTTHDAGRLLAP